MSNFLINNAYRILGLDGSANQKSILKRSKEIINRLNIDDYPEYNLDINLSEKFRTEESVNDALKRLQNMKNNLHEYFFWFNIADTVDEDACDYLQYNDIDAIDDAIEIWKNASNIKNSTGLCYKKNLSLLYCLMLFKEDNDELLKESLSNWKEIIDSDKFWISFEKSYAVNNDLTTNSDTMINFRKNISKYVSDIYHDLYLQYGDKKYVKNFQDIFGTLGDKTEETLLKPTHELIYDTINELKKINLENNDDDEDKIAEINHVCDKCGSTVNPNTYTTYDDGSILCEDCKIHSREWKEKIKQEETVQGSTKAVLSISRIIKKLELQLDQLHEIGLYENVQSIVVRDHAAEAIRGVSIMMHNEAHMKIKSLDLLNLAIKISGTESLKEKCQSDIETIGGFIDDDEENAIVLDMGSIFQKKELIIKSDFIQYKRKQIYYKDVISFTYYNDDKNYVVSLDSEKDDISIKSKNYDHFIAIANRINPIVEPIIVNRLTKLIFEKNREIKIGHVVFDRNGYHSTKRFRNKSVSWQDTIYNAKIENGTVILLEDENDQAKIFTDISMSEYNSVIIPSLIETLYKEYHMRQQN
jgi:hypothetical protein